MAMERTPTTSRDDIAAGAQPSARPRLGRTSLPRQREATEHPTAHIDCPFGYFCALYHESVCQRYDSWYMLQLASWPQALRHPTRWRRLLYRQPMRSRLV
jgi:hypothetical protein